MLAKTNCLKSAIAWNKFAWHLTFAYSSRCYIFYVLPALTTTAKIIIMPCKIWIMLLNTIIMPLYIIIMRHNSIIMPHVRLPLHPATPHWETPSMAVRAIPLSVCRRGPPKGTRPDSNDVRTRSIYSTISIDDINAQSGWSLKTEKIRLKWHVYIDTTHTIRHLFLTWTSLYPFAFLLKLNSDICGTSACFSLSLDLHCYLNCT